MIEKSDLANSVTEYSQTITSKSIAVVGGTSAVSHTSAGLWLKNYMDLFLSFPWMSALSYVAIILLIIERSFIVWSWLQRRKRGDI